jgi:hypothetical protein
MSLTRVIITYAYVWVYCSERASHTKHANPARKKKKEKPSQQVSPLTQRRRDFVGYET